MHGARRILLLALTTVVVAHGPGAWPLSAEPVASPAPAPPHAESTRSTAHDFTTQRELIDAANAARAAGDYEGARAMALEVVTFLLAQSTQARDAAWLEVVEAAGRAAWNAQDARTASVAWEQALEVRERELPDDHPRLQAARTNLATARWTRGDVAGARALYEKVLEVRSRTLPGDHIDLQRARQGVANTLFSQGDLPGARALFEQVLEVHARTLPDDHIDLQLVRQGLAGTLYALGDLDGARVLQEKVLEIQSRRLPSDHPDLQSARQGLAAILYAQTDFQGARALYEKVLDVRSRTLPGDHPHLQAARMNLASALWSQGDVAGARGLYEKVIEVQSLTLSDDSPDLQAARANLAGTLHTQGEFRAARALYDQVLEVQARTLPGDHPDLQKTRANLALNTAAEVGCLGSGRSASERSSGRERCIELIGDVCGTQVQAARAAILEGSSREAEERCAFLARQLHTALSFAQGLGVLPPSPELERASFELAETTRGAALASAELARRAARSPEYARSRAALRAASDALASLAQRGTTRAEFDRARVKRELAERELVTMARELPGGGASGAALEVASFAVALADGGAAVAFRRFMRARLEVLDGLDAPSQPRVRMIVEPSLCAFVLRGSVDDAAATSNVAAKDHARASAEPALAPTTSLSLFDLGPMAPIEEAVRALREALGITSNGRGLTAGGRQGTSSSAHASGVALREMVFDPLLPALDGAERLVVVLDDALNLVPFDALPLGDDLLLGDRFEIHLRTTLTELLIAREPFEGPGELIAFGDVDYETERVGGESEALDATTIAAAEIRTPTTAAETRASPSRSGLVGQAFPPLPGTGVEMRGIARSFADQFGDGAQSTLCERSGATRARLLALAPHARYLHIATHGWFAPESIPSWSDPEPIDKQTGLGVRLSGELQVKGMSPLLLCGLALAGANLPRDAVGHAPGLVTAEELSTLDLSSCALVVLSACDTNVGEQRGGQGVASLQRALHMAGARSVITSLWKVPDEATKELMVDFYRRMWVEKKPKWQALWEAKLKLRHAKDERGNALHTTRDWAAWVLTGESS